MRAACIKAHGGPEVLNVREVPEPLPGGGEVLVRLRASALNRLDLWVREGWPGLKLAFPHVMGADGSGVVEALGEGVSKVTTGDRVAILPGISCGHCEYCLQGEQSLCISYGILGEHINGTHAELVAVPEQNLHAVPEEVTFQQAAAAPLVFMTAWRMLVTRAGVQPGELVLITGAGSGVSMAAIQIAHHLGARVFATTSSDEKMEKARQLGAEAVFNYRDAGYGSDIWRVTERRGVDVIIDSAGGDTWPVILRLLARNGRLVTCGATTGPLVQVDVRQVFARQVHIVGSTMSSLSEAHRVLDLVFSGKLQPVIDSVFELDDTPKAYARMIGCKQFGKIVVNIPG